MWKSLVALAGVAISAAASAQTFPIKPIRFVSTAIAGATDTVGRLIANGLTERMRQQVIIDSRGGANGIIGTEIVARANPDADYFPG